MLFYFYHICLAVFLLQGISIPFLVIAAGLAWWKQSARLAQLERGVSAADRKDKRNGAIESLIERLPNLAPLNCTACGAGVLLHPNETVCPHCGTCGPLPGDYAVAVNLKSQLKGLVKSAVRHWRVANFFTHPVAAWAFFLLIFVEPLIVFPAVVIGSGLYSDTLFDRTLISLGETTAFLIMLSAFLGFVMWMVVFMFLHTLSKSLRRKLPLRPAFETQTISKTETANCRSCGGGIEYDGADFACLCDYCNVENFRVKFAHRERAQAQTHHTAANRLLFGAMEIVEDFTGTFFFVLTILALSSVLLSLFYAAKNGF
ncbi:MAG: hypothetical protein PSX80_15800 [bacterium]|nr:hypothetical protein [bacterium]